MPVPWKSMFFRRLRWSVQALHTKLSGQQTQEASTRRVMAFSRTARMMAEPPSATQAALSASTWTMAGLASARPAR